MEDKIKFEAPQIEYIEFDATDDIIASSDTQPEEHTLPDDESF